MTTLVPSRPLPVTQVDVVYEHGPDSSVQSGGRPGKIIEFHWAERSLYPGTSRTFWVYLPAQYDPANPAALTVFRDGWWYLDPEGEVRAGIVMDNLINSGDIPVALGVFVDPGVFPGEGDPAKKKNRNAEYDAFDARYVSFILSEILPQVTQAYSVSEDHDRWAICGGSSGGNCAFNAAWLRPDRFRRVIASLPSFVQIPGGDPYPRLIAELPARPLSIFLQAGHRDEGWNQPHMNRLASSLRVAAGLAEAGYDFRLVLDDGPDSPNHGGVLLPDALRWLWRPANYSSAES